MKYFNLIFTNHALKRATERGLTREIAWETFNHPDESKKENGNKAKFIKYFDGFKVGLIAAPNEKDEWVIISFWRDPALPGTIDALKHQKWQEYKNAGFWGKIYFAIKQQLGF